jgi:hypothetical protein
MRSPFAAANRLPNIRSPVPQSKMICVPSGAISSKQGVFPPYRHVAGSTVGVAPRTPQKLNLAMGTLIVQYSTWRAVFSRTQNREMDCLA